MVRKIVIISQKGGVGKTTTTVNLAHALARHYGKRVLVIDLDPQADTTITLGIDKRNLALSVFDLLIDPTVPASAVVQECIPDSLWVLPSCYRLGDAEKRLVAGLSRETILEKKMRSIANNYDYILIDCPPGVNLLAQNGLLFGEELIVPIQGQFYALEGTDQLFQVIETLQARSNHQILLLGVLCTMYNQRTTLAAQILEKLQLLFGGYMFTTVIPFNTELAEAPVAKQPIFDYAPRSRGAKTFIQLAKEVVDRSLQTDWLQIQPRQPASAARVTAKTDKLQPLKEAVTEIWPVISMVLAKDRSRWLQLAALAKLNETKD